MMTKAEKKASRKEANHAYYTANYGKWQDYYPKSAASQTGTGNLGAHMLEDENEELCVIEAEMKRLGLRKRTYKGAGKRQ